MFAKCKHIRKTDYMLRETTMDKIPEDLLDGLDELESAEGMFSSSNITAIPARLFKNKRKLSNLKECFYGCTEIDGERRLETLPIGLFDDCINLQDITGIFMFTKAWYLYGEFPANLFSKCPKITKTKDAFTHTNLSKQKQNEILSNIGSYYKNK